MCTCQRKRLRKPVNEQVFTPSRKSFKLSLKLENEKCLGAAHIVMSEVQRNALFFYR